ncbi:LysR family transcriptional regulator [Lacticaseibacillus saniviri]|uniref:Transcription regulator n=1 Tax=Lacticaseibacillus saniviri JCM 17471 = DSM 24301 TaxID=1293598 RepID=A0A0R2MU00_9LACO|nr:LysR family transcriptional regulator [Lacticaseibacillus saniviri]KRO16905.1 transcription regulator [Lacticaseibacillus saniviri JCM 17471 = DSM 24301]MCG4282278.1 LysR family transcriptional regulator [Lacticaseibacillus saniviri]
MFKLLTTFIAVYEQRSFSLAARELYISQPTVSAQIQQLEASLGVQLFDRDGRKSIQATAAGDYFYRHAQQLLHQWQQLEQDIQVVHQQRTPLRFGTSQTTATILLPQLLPDLSTALPNIEWRIHVANSEAILNGIRHQQLDLGIIEKPLVAPDVQRIVFGGDTLSHVGQLDAPWLVREAGSGVGYYTRRYWEQHNLNPDNVIEVDASSVLLELLAQGFGQSLISKSTIPPNVPVHHNSDVTRQFYLVYDREPSQTVTRVVQRLLADKEQ